MTTFSTDLRLGIKCRDLIWFFKGFVEKMGKANLGSGTRQSFCRVPIGARNAIIFML